MSRLLLIVAGGLVLIVLLVYLIMNGMKKRTYRHSVEELEILKYEISNKPIMFELAKLRTVRKSERIVGLVAEWEKRWQDLEEQLKITDDNLAFAEEIISSGDFERAEEITEITGKDLAVLAKKADVLLLEIENLKASELRNRDGIVKLRESVENLKDFQKLNLASYPEVSHQIKDTFNEFDELFVQFDDHMETSNYDLADEVSEKIQLKIDLIAKIHEKIPMYRESIEMEAVPLLDGILDSYNAMREDGIFLEHLNIESEVKKYKAQLETVTTLMQDFEFEKIENLIVNVINQAEKLRDSMKQELDVKDAFEEDLARLKVEVSFVLKEGKSLQERYNQIKGSCLMKSDDEDNFNSLLREINIIDASFSSLLGDVESGEKGIAGIHTSVLSYLTQIGEIIEQLKIFDLEIKALYQNAEDVKAKAVELLNEINQLRSSFEKIPFNHNISHFPSLLERADEQIMDLLEEVNRKPMDVANVQMIVSTTSNVVEKVKSEIGLAVEQLKMAERMLTYGNRYIALEGMYLMDLTIAEDQFHQGNYENTIDKMYKILTDVEGNDFFKVFEDLKQQLGCVFI